MTLTIMWLELKRDGDGVERVLTAGHIYQAQFFLLNGVVVRNADS
jgi:hypothetical protein